ncbi:MAG: transcription-repair coupling factor [Fimbriimonadaceae bacterium]|nr:transcription-repair coupling factor [Fimbriimonadaceae bacterium]
MRLETVVRRIAGQDALAQVGSGESLKVMWTSLCSEARPAVVSAILSNLGGPTLIIAANYDRALQWQARLGLYGIPRDEILLLPSGQSALFEDSAPETVALSDRIGALRALAQGGRCVVIATPQAALERTLPLEVLQDSFIELSVGSTADVMGVVDGLAQMGYEPSEPVRVPGQYSRRGGIIDVFAMGGDRPVRVEFFDDQVESLRYFDPISQRSLADVERLVVAPSRETVLPTAGSGIEEMVERAVAMEAAELPAEAARTLEDAVRGDLRAIRQRVHFDRLDLYRPLVQPDSGCAVDILGDDGLLVLDEPIELDAVATRAEEELRGALEARTKRGEILKATPNDYVVGVERFGGARRVVALSGMDGAPSWWEQDEVHEWGAQSLQPYRGQAVALTQALKNWIDEGLTVVLATDQPMRAKSVLGQVEIYPVELDEADDPWRPGVVMTEGNPAGGFILPGLGFAVLTDHEVFGVGRLKLAQRKFSDGVPVATVLDLKPGDYVVHINFGIGVYQGLVRRVVEGVEKEFLHIEYKAPDRLFVPADQLDRVQKYMAPGDAVPKVNRLTGGDWQKAVGKARSEAREFARDLIKLYAQRKAVERPSYGPDSPWQVEMEQTFPWQETPSQMSAIKDVKRDLQTDYPMDRLVCGDVGFGKTEVAVRAAFKVAQAGRQVAVLCPTTILSEQHYRNFTERLAAFPTRLALLNRFTHAKERAKILRDVEKGEVDILLGTHALLSDELKFKDLGMLIIDEEQKFGVKHKEALKQMRVNVDVLSMSATPIPRTLSMAMMNIREMSLINDPPPGRLPVRTFVRPYSGEVVREALLRELARGGQIYYVYNRVEGIYHIAERLRQLVPTATIAVAHGQMHEKELEPVMVGFIKGEIDILVSTTIVENGLDIPNANTLIVDNADFFGLSQLYQLRGRVGRSDRQAYAYMLYQGAKSLTENATGRLQALAEFSHLGSGYSLAYRDLQIRGAGDMLGAKQSGQMMAVGYDLYTQLIESEVQFLKTYADGDPADALLDPLAGLEPLPSFDLPVRALIPESYVDDQGQRLYYYQKLMSCRDGAQLEATREEMEDRYGHMPAEVHAAVKVMRLRLAARELKIEKVDGNQGRLAVTFRGGPPHPRVVPIMQQRHREVYLSQDRLIWPFSTDAVTVAETLVTELKDINELLEKQRESLLANR